MKIGLATLVTILFLGIAKGPEKWAFYITLALEAGIDN